MGTASGRGEAAVRGGGDAEDDARPGAAHEAHDADVVDVAVIGAGPTGLTLALQLAHFGVRCRVIDAGAGGTRHSRAMAIQPRTLEVLRPLGVTEHLVRRGNPAAQLHVHTGRGVLRTPLFDIGVPDTAHPYLLFLSQAATEQVMLEALAAQGVTVERSTTLTGLRQDGSGLVCTTRRGNGTSAAFRARYVVGCDGASSAVRRLRGIPFVGGSYPQGFVLADLAADGLEAPSTSDPTSVHAYLTSWGPLLFFPLREPAPWRLIAARPPVPSAAAPTSPQPATVDLAELQDLCDRAAGGGLRLRDPMWVSAFTIHHRMATTYGHDRVFLAGDAAHVHSPVGAQGMNTGIQDAVNLGWKLALVARGGARAALLDSYDSERRPVGAFVLRLTDRAFVVATSTHPAAVAARTTVLPLALPLLLRLRPLRRIAFRTVSQLGIRYRHSPVVRSEDGAHRRRRLHRRTGVQPGDRLPDGPVTRDGVAGRLHDVLRAPSFHLLLCGPAGSWDDGGIRALTRRFDDLLDVHTLDRAPAPGEAPNALQDSGGALLRRLGVRTPTQLLVRPDGHVCLRADHRDLTATTGYLERLAAPVPATGPAAPGRD